MNLAEHRLQHLEMDGFRAEIRGYKTVDGQFLSLIYSAKDGLENLEWVKA